jgi:hypothetical protein
MLPSYRGFDRTAIALVVLLAALAGCGGSSREGGGDAGPGGTTRTGASSQRSTVGTTERPGHWHRATARGLARGRVFWVIDSLFASGAWYLAINRDGEAPEVADILMSRDGARWRDVTPPGYRVQTARTPGLPEHLFATAGGRGYLFGATDYGPSQLWEATAQGLSDAQWTPEPASGPSFLPVGVVASGECLYMATAFYPAAGGNAVSAIDIAESCRGKMLKAISRIAFPLEDFVGWSSIKLGADADGPVVVIDRSLYRPRGRTWSRVATTEALGDLVLTGRPGGAVALVDIATGRALSGDRAMRVELPVGQLPDLGVALQRSLVSGCTGSSGFAVVGASFPGGDRSVGAVWSSSDGVRWIKPNVRANGFEHADQFTGVACGPDGELLLIGLRGSRPTSVEAWRGRPSS